MRMLIFALAVVVVLILIGVGFVAYGSFSSGYTGAEMDWNQDGKTTIGEFFRAADIGKRTIEVDGKTCTEYYALKDGPPVKTTCP